MTKDHTHMHDRTHISSGNSFHTSFSGLRTTLNMHHVRKSDLGSVEIYSWMFPYVLGYRNRVPYFKIEETVSSLQKALLFVRKIREQKGQMLLVNTRPDYSSLVRKTASLIGQPYVNEFWVGGLLTNWRQIKYSSHAFQKFETFMSSLLLTDGIVFPKYTKARKRFIGVQNMTCMPDVLILLHATTTFKHILDEAKRLNIPVITCLDTYAPKVSVEYPIPANVHSIPFFHFFCRLLVKVWTAPRKRRWVSIRK